MPELPEVQTTVNGLNRLAKGLIVEDVWTDYDSKHYHGSDTIKDPEFFSSFRESIVGRKILGAERRAKNILINLEARNSGQKDGSNDSGKLPAQTILIHMKMTGHMMIGEYEFDPKKSRDPWTPAARASDALRDPFNRFIHLVFTLSDGKENKPRKQLVLSDMRKFAKVTLLSTAAAHESAHLEDIGPEPLDPSFTFDRFAERLRLKPVGKIKTTLMDKSIIAGIGNIYSDEALWRAGINPEERVKDVSDKDLKNLYEAVRAVLSRGIDFGGDSMSDYRNIHGERGKFQEQHKAYRKTGQPCSKPKCTGTIRRKVVAGRSAHFCDVHQKLQSKRG